MKPNVTLSGKNDSSVLDRQEKNCPDVIEKTVLKVPRRYKEDVNALQKVYGLYNGSVITISLKEIRLLCERDYSKVEAYRGLRKFLQLVFGTTLNIHSQKTGRIQEDECSINNKTINKDEKQFAKTAI